MLSLMKNLFSYRILQELEQCANASTGNVTGFAYFDKSKIPRLSRSLASLGSAVGESPYTIIVPMSYARTDATPFVVEVVEWCSTQLLCPLIYGLQVYEVLVRTCDRDSLLCSLVRVILQRQFVKGLANFRLGASHHAHNTLQAKGLENVPIA